MSSAKPEPKPLPKRFYTAANVQQGGVDFCITLDGKTVKTPAGKLLHTNSEKLAQQIAAEWNAQGEHIHTDAMPLTRLLNIALDRAPVDREAWLEDITRYCDTDLLFYREPVANVIASDSEAIKQKGNASVADAARWIASASPRNDASTELAQLQAQHFDPVLDWCSKTYGIRFALAEGVMPVQQPPETLQKLCSIFAEASDHELAALALMVPLLGSALLALAVWKGAATLDAALIAARLDETVQAKYWGEDMEVAAKWADKARDISAAAFFLTCN